MATTSDQIRPTGRASKRRRDRRVVSAAWIAAVAAPLAALACGDAGGDPESRADLERRFGRQAAQAAADPGPGAGEAGRGGADAAARERGEAGEVGRDGSAAPDRPAPREGPAARPVAEVPPGTAPADEPAAPAPRPDPPPPTEGGAAAEGAEGGAAGGPGGAQEVDLDALLAGAERTYASLSSLRASFVQLMEVPLLERSSTGRGTWYQKGRDRFRMDFEDPPEDEIVADGTHLWLFQPSVQPDQVIRSKLADGVSDSGTPDLLGRILSQARTAYRSRYEGRESVARVPTHLIVLVPTGRSPYREVRVWIGDDRLVRRFQILEENESRRTVTLSGLEPNVPLADSLFRFTPPPGVDVFDG